MKNLYEVGMTGVAIQGALYESLGELTPEIEEALDYLLKQGEEAFDNAAWVVRKLSADSEACKTEANRLKARSEALERSAHALKARMLFAVDAAFHGKLKTAKNTIWGQNSKGGLAIDVAPDTDLGTLYEYDPSVVKQTYSLNTTAIRDRYAKGKPIPEGIVVEERPPVRYLRIS